MSKRKRRLTIFLSAAGFCLIFAAGVATIPAHKNTQADAATVVGLNENLIVRYNMDSTSGDVLSAQKWDSGTQAYVADAAHNATLTYQVGGVGGGTIETSNGIEGTNAVRFTEKAHARASFHLPSDATGMTITMWVKEINTYWASLVEFWDGTNGGRFGKGTMQGNGGRQDESDAWSSNASAHTVATFYNGGGWDSFVILHNNYNNDNGGAAVDPMVTGQWYHLAFTVTSSELKMYRDGVLKMSFPNTKDILASVMAAARNQTDGKLGIRLSLDSSDGDILDDVRIYNGVMSEEEVNTLFYENDYASFKTVQDCRYAVNGISPVYPDLFIDGATEVTGTTVKTGTTQHGISYYYTPKTATEASYEEDCKPVVVTLEKDGMTREVKVTYVRNLAPLTAEVMLSAGGDVSLCGNAPVDVYVPKVLDLTAENAIVAMGTVQITHYEGDDEEDHYHSEFKYDNATGRALITLTYRDYVPDSTVYILNFYNKTGEASLLNAVIGDRTYSESDFSGDGATLGVSDPASFSSSLTVTVPSGAQVGGATKIADGVYTLNITQEIVSSGKITFTVIADDATQREYAIKICSSSAELTALRLSGYPLSAVFDAGVRDYTVEAGAATGSEILRAVEATPVAGATVEKLFDATNRQVVVLVTAEDGVSKNAYRVTLCGGVGNSLVSLKINGADVELTENVGTFAVRKGVAMSELKVEAIALASDAEISYATDEAARTVTISVTTDEGTAIYTVTVPQISNSNILSGSGEDSRYVAEKKSNNALVIGLSCAAAAVALGAGVTAVCLILRRKRK